MRRRRFQVGGLAVDPDAIDPNADTDEEVLDPDADEAGGGPGGAVTQAGGLSALDIPGAQEAFALMAKSSEQARQALQQARESIMKRQYSKADAWLAASAALGAPTRSGSTAESFANMAGALRGPLAARQQFDIQKDKDLLGVNTSLAGLDERQAAAQLALAQLRAKLMNTTANVPNNIVIGPDGKPRYATRQDARGQQAYVTPAANQNVNVNTDKSLYGKMADQLGEEYVGQYKTAANAPQALARVDQVRALLKAAPYTGAGADWKLKAGKVAKALGLNYAGDDIANTEILFSSLGRETLDNVKASGLGSGNGFTDKDLKFLQDVVGGSINLDNKTLSRLADLHELAAKQSVKKWNGTYTRLDKTLLKQLGLTPITLDAPQAPNAAAVDTPDASSATQADGDLNPDDYVPAQEPGAPPVLRYDSKGKRIQ